MLARLQPSLSTVVYRLVYAVLALIAALSLVLVASGRAHSAPVVNGEFGLTSDAHRLAAGADGNMWATLTDPASSVARIAPDDGARTYPNIPTLNDATAITAGPAGRMWVTLANAIGSFDPADPEGTATTFPAIGVGGGNSSLTVGPDGNLWAANGDKVFRITPGGTVDPFTVVGSSRGIASSGGLLWVADAGNSAIVSVTTDGVPTAYPIGGGPQGIAAGSNGQIGFTNPNPPHRAGRLVAGGSPLQTETAPGTDPFGMTYGSDGAYWFAQPVTDNLGRLTADGQYSQLNGLSPDSNPRYVAAGPNNTIWVAFHELGMVGGKKVARVTGLEPPAQPVNPIAPGDMPPIVSKLVVTPRRFRVAKAPTAVSAAKRGKGRRRSVPAGTKIGFSLNFGATVKLTFERKLAGRRRGGKCVKPTRALRSAKRCARYVKRGTLTRSFAAGGVKSVPFSGRIGRRALGAGSYRVTAVATDAGGRSSVPRRANFTVIAPAR